MFDVERAIETVVSARTDADRAYWARFQDQERAKLKSIPETLIKTVRGQNQIEFALQQMATDADPALIKMLAEGYALTGDYQRAVELWPENDEYKKILSAIEKDDSEWCDCPLTTQAVDRTVSNKFIKDKFSDLTLYECAKCRFLNATTTR